MKWLHLLFSIVFLIFALVQWNDPDPLKWIVMYLTVALVAFLASKDKHYFYFNVGVVAFLCITLTFYMQDVLSWVKDGMPDITGSMTASSPYIETVRESIGLLISLVMMIFYFVLSKRKT